MAEAPTADATLLEIVDLAGDGATYYAVWWEDGSGRDRVAIADSRVLLWRSPPSGREGDPAAFRAAPPDGSAHSGRGCLRLDFGAAEQSLGADAASREEANDLLLCLNVLWDLLASVGLGRDRLRPGAPLGDLMDKLTFDLTWDEEAQRRAQAGVADFAALRRRISRRVTVVP
jgi:hypothetical protein